MSKYVDVPLNSALEKQAVKQVCESLDLRSEVIGNGDDIKIRIRINSEIDLFRIGWMSRGVKQELLNNNIKLTEDEKR